MKKLIVAIASVVCLATFSAPSQAGDKSDQIRIAKEVRTYIIKEHKKRRSKNPKPDMDKITKVCGKSAGWTKGCRFARVKSGKEEFRLTNLKTNKIYFVPGMLRD